MTRKDSVRPAPTAGAAAGEPLVRPFAGLLPAAETAPRIAAPPYDVVTSEEARALARGNEWSFLHVSKAEIDFERGTDPYGPEVYDRAGRNLRRMVDAGAVRRDPAAFYYVYRIEQAGHVQTGLVVAGSIAAYRANRIRRHEVTRPEKEDDRVRQIEAVGAQTGPVMAVHRSNPAVAARLARIAAAPPLFAVTAEDGSRHAIWRVDDAADIASLTSEFNGMDALYIADGHHRAAAAARVAALRAERGGAAGEEAPWNALLLICFPEDEARILGYHRVVRDLAGLAPEAFLERLGASCAVEPWAAGRLPPGPGRVAMYLPPRWYGLDLRQRAVRADGPVARLDVAVLAEHVLGPILGVGDARSDPRIDFVGGSDALQALQRRVDGGEFAVAFAMHPVGVGDLCAVADAGGIMPPKSTWFDPKLLDGLVSYPLD